MTAVGVPSSARPAPNPDAWFRSPKIRLAGAIVAVLVVAQIALGGTSAFPDSWNVKLAKPIRSVQSWIRRNRKDDWFLAHVMRPIGDFVLSFYEHLRDLLLGLPWYWIPLLVFLVILRSGRWRVAVGAALGLVFVEAAGMHTSGMETIALMLICVVISVVVGTPIGIWAGLNPRVERVVRPVLDALQTLPVTIFVVPAFLFFGIKQTPAAIATVAFALPPLIKIVSLGIRDVPPASVEAGRIFGSSRWQLLVKVQIPQAVRSLVTAVNQTIMLCLGMVVICSLIGAGGLGNDLKESLRLRTPGRGVIVGLAVFAVAFAFDRLSRSLIDRPDSFSIPGRKYWFGVAGILLAALVIGKIGGIHEIPWTLSDRIADPIDRLTIWIRDTFGDVLQAVNDFVVRDVVIRIRDLLAVSIAWPVLIAATAALAWFVKGWKLAVFCVAALLAVGFVGMWEASLETLAQLVVAVVIAMAIAVPIGIHLGRRPRTEAIVEPFLDALQTFPSLVFAIPFVMIFAVGYVPGILATVLYVIPPGIRLTALAIKQVNPATLEAATVFGATERQRLWGVQVPLAMRGIMLGLNQVIMLGVSMVIIAGLVGGEGLGYLAVTSLIKQDTGLAVEVGIALLAMATVLDQLTQGISARFDPAGTDAHS